MADVGTGPDLVAAATRHESDLVVADVRMPPTHTDDGIVAVERGVDLFQENPAGLGYLLKNRVIQIRGATTALPP